MNIVDRMLHHNHWATRELLEACRPLTPEQFTKHFDMGPGSLHDTIRHIIGAMKRWADRISDREIRPSIEDDPGTRSVDELLQLLDDASEEIQLAACTVGRNGKHDDVMETKFRGSDRRIQFTRGTAIVHVMTHGVHHRAQCLNMLRQIGTKDLPELDTIEWEVRSAR